MPTPYEQAKIARRGLGRSSSASKFIDGIAGDASRIRSDPSPSTVPARKTIRERSIGKGGRMLGGGFAAINGIYSGGKAIANQKNRSVKDIQSRGGFASSAIKEGFPALSAYGQLGGEKLYETINGPLAGKDPNKQDWTVQDIAKTTGLPDLLGITLNGEQGRLGDYYDRNQELPPVGGVDVPQANVTPQTVAPQANAAQQKITKLSRLSPPNNAMVNVGVGATIPAAPARRLSLPKVGEYMPKGEQPNVFKRAGIDPSQFQTDGTFGDSLRAQYAMMNAAGKLLPFVGQGKARRAEQESGMNRHKVDTDLALKLADLNLDSPKAQQANMMAIAKQGLATRKANRPNVQKLKQYGPDGFATGESFVRLDPDTGLPLDNNMADSGQASAQGLAALPLSPDELNQFSSLNPKNKSHVKYLRNFIRKGIANGSLDTDQANELATSLGFPISQK